MESLFTFLFKYRPFFFQRGEFTFQWGFSYWIVGLMILAFSVLLFLVYRHMSPVMSAVTAAVTTKGRRVSSFVSSVTSSPVDESKSSVKA